MAAGHKNWELRFRTNPTALCTGARSLQRGDLLALSVCKFTEPYQFEYSLLAPYAKQIHAEYGQNMYAVADRVRRSRGRILLVAVIAEVTQLTFGQKLPTGFLDQHRMWNDEKIATLREAEWKKRAEQLDRETKEPLGVVKKMDDGEFKVLSAPGTICVFRFGEVVELVEGPKIDNSKVVGNVRQTPAKLTQETLAELQACKLRSAFGHSGRYGMRDNHEKVMMEWMVHKRRCTVMDHGETMRNASPTVPKGAGELKQKHVPRLRCKSRGLKPVQKKRSDKRKRSRRLAEKVDRKADLSCKAAYDRHAPKDRDGERAVFYDEHGWVLNTMKKKRDFCKRQFGGDQRYTKWRQVWEELRQWPEPDGSQLYLALPAEMAITEKNLDLLLMCAVCNICCKRESVTCWPTEQCSQCLQFSHDTCNVTETLRKGDMESEWLCRRCAEESLDDSDDAEDEKAEKENDVDFDFSLSEDEDENEDDSMDVSD